MSGTEITPAQRGEALVREREAALARIRGPSGRFAKGNPGRPLGSRNRVSRRIVTGILQDFEGRQDAILSYLRGYKLETYLDLVWKLLPKSAIDVASMDPMDYTPEERAAVIGRVRRALDRAETGEGSLAEVEQLLLGEPEALEGEVVKTLP